LFIVDPLPKEKTQHIALGQNSQIYGRYLMHYVWTNSNWTQNYATQIDPPQQQLVNFAYKI
jgi:hypothetical protein